MIVGSIVMLRSDLVQDGLKYQAGALMKVEHYSAKYCVELSEFAKSGCNRLIVKYSQIHKVLKLVGQVIPCNDNEALPF